MAPPLHDDVRAIVRSCVLLRDGREALRGCFALPPILPPSGGRITAARARRSAGGDSSHD